jgi:hypothetical protein
LAHFSSVSPQWQSVYRKKRFGALGKPRGEVTVCQIDLAAITFRADFGQNEMAVRMISDMVTRRYDHRTLAQWLGREAPVIALGHTVPFFADRLFEQFVAEGVQFIPLEEAVADPAYEQVGRVASDKFLIYQQKLADLSGRSLPSVAPEIQHLHEKVLSDAAGPLRWPKV